MYMYNNLACVKTKSQLEVGPEMSTSELSLSYPKPPDGGKCLSNNQSLPSHKIGKLALSNSCRRVNIF